MNNTTHPTEARNPHLPNQGLPFPTADQLEALADRVGGLRQLTVYLQALRAAGAPITVDTIHATIVLGTGSAPQCAEPTWSSCAGRRALGLL